MINPLLKFTLPYPQTIPCCPARVSILRKILATAVIHPGRQMVLVCPGFTWYSSTFRDAGGKTRRQSMLLWADSITDVVSLDHSWSWSDSDWWSDSGHWCCVTRSFLITWVTSWLAMIFSDQRLTHPCAKVTLSVLFVRSNVILCGTHWSHLTNCKTFYLSYLIEMRRMAKKILEFCDRCCYWA